ncbi:putative DNA repair enzyme [Trypanosoma grayi]|uniref:putative DNA repair enzyme n=1 Tax=Trypanosoma grayi TaxID=71804 RepID=UPI0004F44454|nr:putative DNA repair enzyme [Trypanosoma grayi]KEG13981.1 putative DNA repair enzyme [Trypanosoma grayi]
MAKRSRSPSSPLQVAAFLFRRDFRLVDNTGLLQLRRRAASESLRILPLFFFNTLQCDPARNAYFGKACFEFLCRSLRHLSDVQLDGRLLCLRGSDADCLEAVHAAGYDVKYLGFNRDITPFARERDAQLQEWCQARGVSCVTSDVDYTLLPVDAVVTASEQPYRVFTPFYRKLLQDHFHAIPLPDCTPVDVNKWFVDASVKDDVEAATLKVKRRCGDAGGAQLVDYIDLGAFPPVFPQLAEEGGRDEGMSRMSRIAQATHYAAERDDIVGDYTTHLSPHLKFGTVSIREVMQQSVQHLGKDHAFTRQLIWREFYAMLLFHNPRVAQGQLKAGVTQTKQLAACENDPFDKKYVDFHWSWDDAAFTAFKEGRTGVPLVDAAVRCLTQTGWCHNRCRMIIANFLVKVLFVDWREGERWYATVAVDYDVANNNGGWLWSSGQGADAQPYFRTFNPFRQSAQHDPDAVFIKQWVPELREVSAKTIHEWDVYCEKHRRQTNTKLRTPKVKKCKEKKQPKATLGGNLVSGSAYPSPIVDVKQRTRWVIERYKEHAQQLQTRK